MAPTLCSCGRRPCRRVRDELPRFSLVYIATLIGAIVALPLLLRALPYNIYVIQAGYTVAAVALSYVGHKFFSFRDRVGPDSEATRGVDEHAGT